jgi:16S rRNA processing protein RimM
MDTGSNDVLVVRGTADSLDGHERLIPWLPGQVVKDVDMAGRVITVDWDPGF